MRCLFINENHNPVATKLNTKGVSVITLFHHAHHIAVDANTLLAEVAAGHHHALVGRGVAGAGVARRDHDRDALGCELGEVSVDDVDIVHLALDLRQVALPAVAHGVHERAVVRRGEVRRPRRCSRCRQEGAPERAGGAREAGQR